MESEAAPILPPTPGVASSSAIPATRSPGLLRLAFLALGLVLLGLALRGIDLSHAAARLLALGPAAVVSLFPYGVALAFDTLSFRAILGALGSAAPYGALLRVRVATEALALGMPAGPLVAETVKPYLLRDRAAVPVPVAVGAIGGRRIVIIASHALMIALAALAGGPFLERVSPGVIGGNGLQALAFFGAGVLLAAALVLRWAAIHGSPAERLLALLRRIPSRRLAVALDGRVHSFERTDANLLRFLQDRRALTAAIAAHLMAWLSEAAETFVLLRILGVPIEPAQALSIEALLAVLRSAVFFVPAGLGVQEIGYLAFLRAAGFQDPGTVGAAFVALKRIREVSWLAASWLLLGYSTRHRQIATTASST